MREIIKPYAVITGDIRNYTKLDDQTRKNLTADSEEVLFLLAGQSRYARMFRGDSFQLQLSHIEKALKTAIQLICWFKLHSDRAQHIMVGTRLSIGIGTVAFEGKSVLDSDGEAYHLSGRNFDHLGKSEIIRITTNNEEKNKLCKILMIYINMIVDGWSISQAQIIFELLNKELARQSDIADQLNISQPSVAKSLRAARWKEVELGINYINDELLKLVMK